MNNHKKHSSSGEKKRSHYLLATLGGTCFGIVLVLAALYTSNVTSTNESCAACHVHPDAETSWKQSPHFANESGVQTDCAACHLPPEGTAHYYWAKATTGLRDVWMYLTHDKEDFDWESKRTVEYAPSIVYNESCKKCHTYIFPQGITDDGVAAHLYYEENEEKLGLQCVSCHLDAGHFIAGYKHEKMTSAPVDTTGPVFTEPATVTSFSNFTETIPGTRASISMIAVPGGKFTMGSQKGDKFSRPDEYPAHEVTVSPFFMAEMEVTWDQYWAFYAETMSEGRTKPETIYANNSRPDVDAVSGPTPPFGMPDQGWGMGSRPAITMTHYAAETFCQWLSLKTGRHYRLPTEAEWEYAARGGTDTPYFFEGKPSAYSSEGLWNSIFGTDTTTINRYAIYALNSKSRTQEPSRVAANPFGLRNMLGNVMEYCQDWYAEDAYEKAGTNAVDPKGPASGTDYVVRGGCYNDDASELRCAARRHSDYEAWLKTDPQNPKSIWWLSDIKGIGFRVVCDNFTK